MMFNLFRFIRIDCDGADVGLVNKKFLIAKRTVKITENKLLSKKFQKILVLQSNKQCSPQVINQVRDVQFIQIYTY